jgi:MoaA/NifB/PqqE/SkfB family radical SAM enzyme
MSLDRYAGALRWSKQNGVAEITLLGGEPSLHPSFVDMVNLAAGQQLAVRIVTNGAPRFQRSLADGSIGPQNVARVAVSLDTMDSAIQDQFRGPRAWRDAIATIAALREHKMVFDVNVTAVRAVLPGLCELIDFADEAGCRRVNIHWPSTIGLGAGLSADEIPVAAEWADVVERIGSRTERRPDFFVEIERGFLAAGEPLTACALTGFSNLQILPDGRAYRCGLLVDQAEMASLRMAGDQLRVTRPEFGEDLLAATMTHSCDSCPVALHDGRRACIYDKVSSAAPLRP